MVALSTRFTTVAPIVCYNCVFIENGVKMQKTQMSAEEFHPPLERSAFNQLTGRTPQGSNSARIAQLQSPSSVASNPLLSHLPLKRGDTGEGVKLLQQSLNHQGMELVVDGIFGPATERAVKVLQGSRNLDVTGVMTADCITVLPSLTQSTPSTQSTSSSQDSGALGESSFGSGWIDEGERLLRRRQQGTPNALTAHLPLSIGSRGEPVRLLQTQLNQQNANMSVDGDFGRQTENIVRAFQAANNLMITGKVDSLTAGKMYDQNSKTVDQAKMEGIEGMFIGDYDTYDAGQKGDAIPVVMLDGCRMAVWVVPFWTRMRDAARAEGVELRPNSQDSGFRTYQDQARLREKYGARRAAGPGWSNHQTGHAIDIRMNNQVETWLSENAGDYGWVRDTWEDWHWEYWGPGAPAATGVG